MRPTKEYIEQSIQEINAQCFNSELPMLPVIVGSGSRRLGCLMFSRRRKMFRGYENYNFRMSISTRYDFTEEQIRDTICHEMIHYYIAWKQLKDTSPHGDLFRSMMTRINKEHGYHMTISQRLTDEEIASAPRNKTYLVCISHFSDGQTGVTISAKTRIFKLWDEMQTLRNITDMQWYLSHDPYWDKYRTSLRAAAYTIDPEDAKSHLKDAKRLIRNGNTITTMKQNIT